MASQAAAAAAAAAAAPCAVESLEHFQQRQAALAGDAVSAIFFWAEWHPPSKQMLAVVAEAAREFPAVGFFSVEAERVPEVTELFPVKSVPTAVLARAGQVLEVLEGANPPALVAAVARHARAASAAAVGGAPSPSPAPAPAPAPAPKGAAARPPVELTDALRARLEQLVRAAPVMLFMKGSPEQPRCGFSAQMVEVLRKENAVFGSFDILTDNEVREGLKKLSNWPTFPQLYVQGKLVGGLDVAKELQAEGELAALLPAESKRADLNERLAKLVRQQRVMVFIKGTPQQPRCGFSAQMLELLRHYDVEFGHFDVLEDDAVRQGLKAFSNFPTFPQLYVDGKLVGGLDICAELHREAELELILAPPKPEAAAANAAE